MNNYKQGQSDLHQLIRKIMRQKRWWKPWMVQNELNNRRRKRIAESTVTREMRRMADLMTRPCHNDSWDYSLIKGVNR